MAANFAPPGPGLVTHPAIIDSLCGELFRMVHDTPVVEITENGTGISFGASGDSEEKVRRTAEASIKNAIGATGLELCLQGKVNIIRAEELAAPAEMAEIVSIAGNK